MDTQITMAGWSPAMSLVNKSISRATLDLTFTNLNYTVGKGDKAKTILKEISGTFKSGQLIGILGASGAGKTSLMNILAGLKNTGGIDGVIEVNGVQRDLKSFRKQSAYIMQKDHLLPNLTVDEYMTAAADLKLGDKIPKEEKKSIIQLVLQTLGLGDTRQTRISCLSGGECKRFSIGLELIANPSILFLDEPTSGLDSSSSLQLVTLLNKLARSGRTVVATIHQPSSRILEHFDLVYFVADGMCLYQGSVQALIPFFRSMNLNCPANHNPADFAIDVACGVYGDVLSGLVSTIRNGRLTYLEPLAEATNQIDEGSKIVCQNEATAMLHSSTSKINKDKIPRLAYPASFYLQFVVLLRRSLQTIWRDRVLMWLRFGIHVFVAFLIGFLHWQIGNEASLVLDNSGFLFFNHLFVIYAAMMPSAMTFSLERKVLVREHLNHWYSLKAYYLAKTLADVPFQVLFPAVYLTIGYLISNQPLTLDRFAMLMGTSILIALVGQGIGLCFGAAFSVPVATYFAPTSTIPFLVICGLFVSTEVLPTSMRWILYPSFFHHAFQASMVSMYGYERAPLDCADSYCHFRYPVKLLEMFAIPQDSYTWSILGLLIIFFATRLAGYFILRFKIRHIR